LRSFAILRTNVGLTTNVKVVVDSKYGLSLDSIDSTPELSFSKYKKFDFIKTNYYDELVPYFYDGLPAEIAYTIKYDDDSDSMSDDFSSQYDEIYQYGARNIVDNKNYNEEYEYFAPLYIYKNKLPKNFIIFRVDKPGVQNIDRFNVRNEVFKKFKTVSVFDLTKTSALGEWLDININDNSFYPKVPFEMSYTKLEFSQWNGIDFRSGGYVSKSQFLDDTLEEEKEIFELEKFIFDGYKNNKVIFSNIINFSFLFDDTPADAVKLNKWSINRYYGFYLDDMELIKTVSPYITPFLNSDVVILDGNILYSELGDPFEEGWSDSRPFYVEYDNNYYKVEKFTETQKSSIKPVSSNTTTNTNANASSFSSKSGVVQVSTGQLVNVNNPVSPTYVADVMSETKVDKWRIISKFDLTGKQSMLNKNIGYIDKNNILINYDQSYLSIDDFDFSDICVIEINGKYHNVIKNSDGNLQVYTDYSFEFFENDYIYYINKTDLSYTTRVSFVVDDKNPPKMFKIYRLKFTDIKDFDDRIVDTEPSKFEYEKLNELTETDETKLYLTNLNSNTNPKQLDDFIYKEKVVHIPVASEYTANHETFKVIENQLSPIWRKNPVYCRWAFEGSISANDYPYLLNNSDKFEDYNRTVNPFDPDPSRYERNLDYFYTINSSTFSYLHHTLHIENTNSNGLDNNFKFDFDKYLGRSTYITPNGVATYSVDYFSYFFTKKSSFLSNNIVKNTKKYSTFISGDIATPNVSLFRGIKFSIYDVENIKMNSSNQIEVVNMKSNNTFEDYKLSILLTSEDNGMVWNIIDNWEVDKLYKKNTIVSYDDVLYIATEDNICTTPIVNVNVNGDIISVKSTPYNQLSYTSLDPISSNYDVRFDLQGDFNPSLTNKWKIYKNPNSIFWSPLISLDIPPVSYKTNDLVYKDGNYYIFTDNSKPVDFWNPLIAYSITSTIRKGYSKDSLVIYNNKFYISLSNNNINSPDNLKYWEEKIAPVNQSKWISVSNWNPSLKYSINSYVIYNDIVFISIVDDIPSNEIPSSSKLWKRVYSIKEDTNYVYQKDDNPILLMNNKYYMIINNPKNKTLENGITIYINKKMKNILINIFINDNTISDLKGKDRDFLYNTLNKKLTATNFINCINNLSNKYEFSDFLKYIIIDEDGKIVDDYYSYDHNIQNLKHILFAERPEPLEVKVNSLDILGVNIDKLKPSKVLNDGKINSLSELNYFNNIHIATEIVSNNYTPLNVINYSGLAPISKNRIYRFSGNYIPLFYDISLFNKDNSIKYNEIRTVLDLSDAQNVSFNFSKNDKSVERILQTYPGMSYSSIKDFYKQVIDNINNEELFSGIDFYYEIGRIGDKINNSLILNLDENSYDSDHYLWEDISGFSNNTKVINNPNNTIFTKSDLYPGNYMIFSNDESSIITFEDPIKIFNNSSYEFWVNVDSSGTQSFMGDGNRIAFGFYDDKIFYKNYYYYNNTYTESTIYSDPIVKPNTWYHIVFTNRYEPAILGVPSSGRSYQDIYIDGVKRTGSAYTSGIVGLQNSAGGTNDMYFTLGAPMSSSPMSDKFSGKISNIRIYDRVLSDGEIYTNFLNQHSELIIRYKASEGNLKVDIKPIYPSLYLNFIDYFDPLITDYYIQFGATGGNPPYTWSVNGGSFTTYPTELAIVKGTTNKIVVKDIIGLTASDGYYTINSYEELVYKINGDFTY
jgi:hypothetical protein